MGSPHSMAISFVLSLLVFLLGKKATAISATNVTSTTSLSQSPSFMQCGYKHFWANDHKTITYDRLITDHTLGDYLGNFDLEVGTFTAGTPGTMFYRVSPPKNYYSGNSRD